jgi:hypothetical protein
MRVPAYLASKTTSPGYRPVRETTYVANPEEASCFRGRARALWASPEPWCDGSGELRAFIQNRFPSLILLAQQELLIHAISIPILGGKIELNLLFKYAPSHDSPHPNIVLVIDHLFVRL